ncbi:hypothetical protein ADILRU_1182 [Leifsonia rubra CMS 76R]|nr:hypothetical protein ADILRU_1182 [Leifsonia rubra CMS 76R]
MNASPDAFVSTTELQEPETSTQLLESRYPEPQSSRPVSLRRERKS